MSSIGVGVLAFALFLGGALVGMRVRAALPEHHLDDASRNLLGLSLGIVGTMAGLVLGLLVSAATASYNAQRSELLDASSKIVLLDRILAHYGPSAKRARDDLRTGMQQALNQMWFLNGTGSQRLDPQAVRGETVADDLDDLPTSSDRQRTLKPEALQLAINIAQTRWLMFEQAGSGISVPLLVLLIFWFTITFLGFGLLAPSNATVVVALALGALAVSGAVFVTLELYMPFEGLMRLPSAPFREALEHLGARP
jgi:hypothetical protein